MVHLVMHLVTEAKIGRLIQYRWMYPIEKYLSCLKSYVRNRVAHEGWIAKRYIVKECLTFCLRYMERVETIFNRPIRAIEESIGVVSSVTLDNRMHKSMVEDELRKGHCRISEAIIHNHYMKKFYGWFRSHVLDTGIRRRKRQLLLVYVGEGSSHS